MDVLSAQALGALCALGSALTWAVITSMVRTLRSAFNSVQLNALRTSAAGALLVGWVLAVHGVAGLTAVSGPDFLLLALSIIVASSFGDTVFFEASQRVGVALALTLSMTYPLMAAFFAAAFLGEPVTGRLLAGSLLTLGGLALIVTSRDSAHDRGQWWLGFACAMLASLAWAVAAILLKAPLREMDAITSQALRMPISGLLLFLTPWARGSFAVIARSSPSVRRQLVALCVLTTLSSTMFAAGVKYAGVAVGTVLSSTSPMWALPIGYLMLGERLELRSILGLVITLLGIVILQL